MTSSPLRIASSSHISDVAKPMAARDSAFAAEHGLPTCATMCSACDRPWYQAGLNVPFRIASTVSWA
jgi:hypothetical protein